MVADPNRVETYWPAQCDGCGAPIGEQDPVAEGDPIVLEVALALLAALELKPATQLRRLAVASGYQIALITTDLNATAAQIVERYADRWPIEVAFEEGKEIFGVGHARAVTCPRMPPPEGVRPNVSRTCPLPARSFRDCVTAASTANSSALSASRPAGDHVTWCVGRGP